MKTSELVEEIAILGGFIVATQGSRFVVSKESSRALIVGTVEMYHVGMLNTNYFEFDNLKEPKKLDLLNLLVEYAMTPVIDREEPKRYIVEMVLENGWTFGPNKFLREDSKHGVVIRCAYESEASKYTQEELEEMGVWGNELFKVREVQI